MNKRTYKTPKMTFFFLLLRAISPIKDTEIKGTRLGLSVREVGILSCVTEMTFGLRYKVT